MSPLGTLEAPERRPDTELDSSVDNLNAMLPDLGAIDFDKEKAEFDAQAEQTNEAHSDDQDVNLEASVTPEVPADIHEEITRVRDALAQTPARPIAPAAPAPRPQQPPVQPPAGQQGPQPPQEQQPPAQPAPGHDVPRFTLGIVDQTKDARVMAGRAADEQLGVETNEGAESGGKLKTFIRSVWKMGSLKPWFRQRRKNKALNEIVEQQDVYLHDGATDEERKQARLAAVDRFVRGRGYYSESAGEQRAELAADSPLATGLKDIIRQATDPQGQRPSNDELKRRYQELVAQHPDELKGEGRVTAHNLIEVIDNMRGADLHRDALQHAITNMAIITGESRAESNKNEHSALNDRIIDKLERLNTKLAGKGGALGFVGNLAPEGVISLGITGAMIAAGAARDSLIRKAGWAIAPGVGGAAVGALRGWSDANQRIRQHESERESGKVFQNDKRRQALDALMYEDKPARELIDTLRNTANREKITEGDEALKAALKALAEVTVRQGFFDDGKKVIRFSPGAKKQGELRDLADARRDAAVLLGSHISTFDQQTRERLGFPDGADINSIQELPEFGGQIVREIQADIDQKDKDRRGYKLKTGAGAGAIRGAVFSAGVSFGINVAAGGIAELYDGGSKAETVSQSALVNQNNEISINGDYTIESDFSGLNTSNFDVKGPDGNVVIDNIHKDPITGKIDDADLKRLVDAGFEVKPIDIPAVTETTTVSLGDYINSHPQEFRQLDIQWMDNNTTAFDLNEQGGQLVANPDGTVTITQNMTAGGSFHDGMGIDMTDTSPYPNVFDMAFKQPDGTFLHKTFNYGEPIPKPWADMLYQKDDGTWGFKGGEGSHVSWGKLEGDTFYSAASVPSDGESINITDTVEKTPASTSYEIKGLEHHSEAFPTIAVVGVPGTRGLTKTIDRPPEVPPYRPDYRPSYTAERREELVRDMSPRLQENPGADLDPGEELTWFSEELERREGSEYVEAIRRDIASTPELSNVSENIRTITTIPVAAASESENIYSTLSLYAKQDPKQVKNNMILLNVNWLDTAMKDSKKRNGINKTMQEIERARNDFPDLNIAVMKREYNAKKVEASGGVIGYVASDLLNTALLTLNENIKNGSLPHDADVAIIRQDADMRGMSRHYLAQLEKSMSSNKEVDVFHGSIRYDVRSQDRYPGLGIVTNFSQAMGVINSSQGRLWTVGINSVARAATLAAVGGLGKLTWTGAGSDDVNMGTRITSARGGATRGGAYSPDGYLQMAEAPKGRRVAVSVAGMTVDTSADRLIPQYLKGRYFGAAWNSSDSGKTSFGDGPGGYRDRTKDADIMRRIKHENVNGKEIYERIEKNMNGELNYANPETARRVLSMFFAGVPNAYQIGGEIGSGSASFTLLPAGRDFIKQRIIRETNGSRGAGYGARKMRQLYGMRKGRRNPVARESPLVSPSR